MLEARVPLSYVEISFRGLPDLNQMLRAEGQMFKVEEVGRRLSQTIFATHLELEMRPRVVNFSGMRLTLFLKVG